MFKKLQSYLKQKRAAKRLVAKQDYTFGLISRTDRSAKGTLVGELNVSEVDQLASVSRIFDNVENPIKYGIKEKSGPVEIKPRPLIRNDVATTRFYPISQETYIFEENGDRIIVGSIGTYKDGVPVPNK